MRSLRQRLRRETPPDVDLTKLPLPIAPPQFDRSLLEYWSARIQAQVLDRYAGVRLLKMPEDLRVYEHLLWTSAPEVVVEVGTQSGGSALWFRDRMLTLKSYGGISRIRVITVDLDNGQARRNIAAVDPDYQRTITVLDGDILDPQTSRRIAALVPAGSRCMVVEDSAHVYETTLAALRGLYALVAPGGFFVVEDGCVDVEQLRVDSALPRGVLPAVSEFLTSDAGREFVVRRDLELYGLTANVGGYLQRSAPSMSAPT